MRTAHIGHKTVGDGHPCFISLEAGATHSGLDSALELVEAAAAAGADAVKFQTVDTEELMSGDNLRIEYRTQEGKRTESVFRALKRRELPEDDWRRLKRRCDELGILFISTPSGPRTVDLLADMGAAAIKVAKSDVNNRWLIRHIAGKGRPVILDARERFEDVENALRICEEAGVRDVVIMHCPSGYPAEHAGIHLRAIPQIKSVFGYPVAYSDHSEGEAMNFAAIGLGVNMIEKTITLDRDTDAVEHFMSLEPGELARFVRGIRAVEEAMGNPRIIFSSRVNAEVRRSIMASRAIRAGEAFGMDNLSFKRPGTHLSVDCLEQLLGRRAARDLAAGEFLELPDLAAARI